ncbi:alpha/beta fold hydrolase [Saccharothrix australiensis]|uniref:alpha/beta fold hydrolase n=1 Tax=Saccharothrix australiensis TaxID=2072 RepID=UPI001FE3EFC3|nr:alpha/beta fold hydrolase [Saccharothrix australiensis]
MRTPREPLVTGSGPALVLAHGAGSDLDDSFGPVIDRLARAHRVIGADYPGSGANPRAPLTLDGLADHVVAAADAAGADRFALLGFSMGTAVAVRAATRHPDRVTALVLSAGLAHPDARLRLAVDVWRALADRPRTLAAYLTLVVNSPDWVASRPPAALAAQLTSFAATAPPGVDDQLALLRDVDVRADLPSITAPTLVVAARADVLVRPAHSARLAAGIPGATLVTLDCGHAIAAEDPDGWATAVTRFLAGLGGPAQG